MTTIKALCAFIVLGVVFGGTALADGLKFAETMRGYAKIGGQYKNLQLQLAITIADIDAWKTDSQKSASVTGYYVFDNTIYIPLSGVMNILAPSPTDCSALQKCYRLAYRLTSNLPGGSFFVGYKLIKNDVGPDALDDMTHLRGCFTGALNLNLDTTINASCLSEVWFEWWDFSTLYEFSASLTPINTPWWRYFSLKTKFLGVVFADLAATYFPWMFVL